MTNVENKPLPNIIFLDMDGVLCNPRACLAVGNTGGVYPYLDPIACLLVKKLCVECNARLVISSAWRLEFEREAMEAILNANCPSLGNFMWPSSQWWRTTSHSYAAEDIYTSTTDRGREIKHWLDNNEGKYNNFCILDDMADMRPLQEYLVRCDTYDGIGFMQYHHAEDLLMAGYSV